MRSILWMKKSTEVLLMFSKCLDLDLCLFASKNLFLGFSIIKKIYDFPALLGGYTLTFIPNAFCFFLKL